MAAPFIIEALAAHHNRTDFSCGVEALDRYFQKQVTQDVRRRATACYVATAVSEAKVAGYYTLAALGVPLAEMPIEVARRLPRYPSVPVARLGRMAVDQTYNGASWAVQCCGMPSSAVYDPKSTFLPWWSLPRMTRQRPSTVTTASSLSVANQGSLFCHSPISSSVRCNIHHGLSGDPSSYERSRRWPVWRKLLLSRPRMSQIRDTWTTSTCSS